MEHNNCAAVATLLANVHELTLLVRQANSGQGVSNRRPGRKVCLRFTPCGAVHRQGGVETKFVVVARIGNFALPPLRELRRADAVPEYMPTFTRWAR